MTLLKHQSYHFPLLFEFKTDQLKFASSFKFQSMWTQHTGCKELIENSWKENVVGCPMHILSTKLKILKAKLKLWNKEVFENVNDYVENAETQLKNIQHQIQTTGHTNSLQNLEKAAHAHLEDALKKQNLFWKDKARVNWHINGDINTKYFHRVTKIKNKTKLISHIRNNNEMITDPDLIAEHIVNYYKWLFSTNTVLQDSLLVDEVIPGLIDEPINTLLTKIPTAEEIKHAVFDMNKDGAPDPDGFGGLFYQKYWEVIKKDVINAVLEFFATG